MAETRWYVYMICSYYFCKGLLELYKSTFSPSPHHLFQHFPSFLFLQLTTFSHFPFSFSSFPVSAPVSHFLFSPISFLLVSSLCHISQFPFCFFLFVPIHTLFLSFFSVSSCLFLPFSNNHPIPQWVTFLGIYIKAHSNFPLSKIIPEIF